MTRPRILVRPPETTRLLKGRGLSVVTVSISEFERVERCVTCLSVRLR